MLQRTPLLIQRLHTITRPTVPDTEREGEKTGENAVGGSECGAEKNHEKLNSKPHGVQLL